MGSTAQALYPVLQVIHGRIFHAGIIRTFFAAGKYVGHLSGIGKLKRYIGIQRY